jgi:hypothetical protein
MLKSIKNESTVFESKGNIEILSQNKIALFASRNAPNEIIVEAEKIFIELRKKPVAVASGWQAPLEKRLFDQISDRDKANYIYYTAKDIKQISLKKAQQKVHDDGKLLLISPQLKTDRISGKEVDLRDELILSQINKILFLYIQPGGRLEKMLRQLSLKKYVLFFLDHPQNRIYLRDDIISVDAQTIVKLI